MEKLQQLREIYEAYIEQTVLLQRNAKPLQGFLGFGQRLGTDPCHGAFAETVEQFAKEAEVTSEEAKAILEYAFTVPDAHKKNELAYWMLLAVHGKMFPLTEKLTAQDAKELLAMYDRLHPKRLRMPVQKDLAKKLKHAAK